MIRVFVGFDPREQLAFDVCCRSLKAHASVPVDIIPLKEWELRRCGLYWRAYHVAGNGQMEDDRDRRPFSTQFSFTRFAVPALTDYADEWVLYCDCDMLWRADIAELFALADKTAAVMCVKHNQVVTSDTKMDGRIQLENEHGRKNWSSLMLMNPARCHGLTKYVLNNSTGVFLHALLWAPEVQIVGLPSEWNHLVGYSDPSAPAKVAHFTNGSPDMAGWEQQPFADEWWAWARNE